MLQLYVGFQVVTSLIFYSLFLYQFCLIWGHLTAWTFPFVFVHSGVISMKRKLLAVGIIFLLIGVCIIPSNGQLNLKCTSRQNHPITSITGNWTEIQKIHPLQTGKYFGYGISIENGTALVGAPQAERVYVFIRENDSWVLQTMLSASDGGGFFGFCVSLCGDTALVGAWMNDNRKGCAYVFTRTGNTWTQQAKLVAPDGLAWDMFGWSVSLDGDTALIGADYKNSSVEHSGSVYVFVRNHTTWSLQQKLLASDGAEGDFFGHSVTLHGDTAFIGAPGVDSWKGAIYMFTRSGTIWTQQSKLMIPDGVPEDGFGTSLSSDGTTVLIGAPSYNNMYGSAYVFIHIDGNWCEQAKLIPSDGTPGDSFGYDLCFNGDTAFIGAMYDDAVGIDSGSTYVFLRTGTHWTLQTKLVPPEVKEGDEFGYGICLDGDTAFIGATCDNDLGYHSGAVYVFKKVYLSYNLTGGLGVKLKITNNGEATVTNVPWQIHVKGGIFGLINTTMNGTIDIPAGESKTVGTGMLFGFGALSITAIVAGKENTVKGTQLFIFSIMKK